MLGTSSWTRVGPGKDPATLTVAGGSKVPTSRLDHPRGLYYGVPSGTLLVGRNRSLCICRLATAKPSLGARTVDEFVLTIIDGATTMGWARGRRCGRGPRIGATVTTPTTPPVGSLRRHRERSTVSTPWPGSCFSAAAFAAFDLVTGSSRRNTADRRRFTSGVPRRRLAVRRCSSGPGRRGSRRPGVAGRAPSGRPWPHVFESFLPLPIYRTRSRSVVIFQAAALGVTVPVLGAALPTLRRFRVEPIEANPAPGHLPRRRAVRRWAAGSPTRLSLIHIPIRNVMRPPRRTCSPPSVSVPAVRALVGVLGLLDSSADRSTRRFRVRRRRSDRCGPTRHVLPHNGDMTAPSPTLTGRIYRRRLRLPPPPPPPPPRTPATNSNCSSTTRPRPGPLRPPRP